MGPADLVELSEWFPPLGATGLANPGGPPWGCGALPTPQSAVWRAVLSRNFQKTSPCKGRVPGAGREPGEGASPWARRGPARAGVARWRAGAGEEDLPCPSPGRAGGGRDGEAPKRGAGASRAPNQGVLRNSSSVMRERACNRALPLSFARSVSHARGTVVETPPPRCRATGADA